MDYQNRHKQQFAYRLGEQEEWVKLEGNRIHFNRLSYGTFRLQVKVYEPNGYDNPVIFFTYSRPSSVLAFVCRRMGVMR